MTRQALRGFLTPSLIGSALAWIACSTAWAQFGQVQPSSIVREIQGANERQEMTVNTSRILTLSPSLTEANKIPRAQVNNPDVLELTALSATQIQVSAKKPGVTQVNMWDENGKIYTVDVIVYGDAQELSMLLQSEFPNATLRVIPVSDGVLISGYVDQADDIRYIMQLAEQYYPNVLDNIRVGGVHQVLLHVKVMEVSRTKLRNLGFDWSIVASNGLFTNGTSGLLKAASGAISGSPNIRFDIFGGSSDFFGVLEALREDKLAKVLAEPTLVTTSGRPAFFLAGGEVPYPVPQGLGTVGVEYKEYGVRVDFVPIVLGNGRIRLEVRPRVTDIDSGRARTIGGDSVDAFKKQEVDTGVQMQAGQTLAIAGLVQNRIESTRRGIPWVSDLPYVGAAFRRVEERNNEIETLIFVTPELVDAMDAEEVPPCGLGSRTASPSDWELGLRGHIEVPNCCPPGAPGTIQGEPGQIMPPGQILTPAPSQPPVPRSSAGSFPGRLPRQVSTGRPGSRPVTVEAGSAPDLPGFMGPIGYDVAE